MLEFRKLKLEFYNSNLFFNRIRYDINHFVLPK